MQKGVAILGLCLLMVSSACKEVKEKLLPAFNVNIPAIELSIPPIPFVPEKEIPVGSLRTPINLDSTIKANTAGTLGANSVHIIRIKKIDIKVVNADQKNNLSNFENARMVIAADTASAEIAVIQFPKTFTDSLSVTPTNNSDIHSFLKGSYLGYNLYWKNRKPTSKFMKLDVRITLSVQ
ncbi:MAG: hypothetical protein JWQ96_45 [Segetibacter sp.]|nr:hypothetical protein [Segetibacter sp.]